MKALFRISRFAKPYWKQALLSLILLTIVVVLDLLLPRLVQQVIDQGILKQNADVILKTSLLMLGISLVNTLFAIGNNTFSVQVGESFGRDLRERMFLKIQEFSFGNLDRNQTGVLMVRLSSDVSIVQRVIQIFLRIGTRAPLLMVGSILLMFATDTRLALMILVLLLGTSLIVVLFSTRTGPLFMVVQQKLDRLNTLLQEAIAGVRVLKSFVRESHENDLFLDANQDYSEQSIRVTQIMSLLMPLLSVLMNMGVVVVIWSGGMSAIKGSMTVGQIVAFSNYLLTTIGPLGIMAQMANVIAAGMASAERVEALLNENPEIPALKLDVHPESPVEGRVEFKHVHFHYPVASETPVLEDISFTAQPGQTVAILGATGSGKSTLVNLIPRFYDPTEGTILIDGQDIRTIPLDLLHRWIGITLQESVLFSGTIRENLRLAKPDASDEEVRLAAMTAQAHDFVQALPMGYDTPVEQRGVNLSGGQKQRLAIARAILSKPPLLILDDSTSAVDVETETHIQDALKEWMKGSTSFIVAQRISTVLNADHILVLEKGRLVAQGTHRELLQSSTIYREIYESQLGNGLVNGTGENKQ